MAKVTITTGITIATAETTTTITTTTTTITTEAPAETAITEAPTEVETTGTLPAPETGAIAPALQKMQDSHEKAVEYCINLDAEEFASLIMWAQHHKNKFPAYAVELRDVVNADDVYKDAIIRICTPLGEEVVRKAIKLVDTKKILDLAEYLEHIKFIVEEWGEV